MYDKLLELVNTGLFPEPDTTNVIKYGLPAVVLLMATILLVSENDELVAVNDVAANDDVVANDAETAFNTYDAVCAVNTYDAVCAFNTYDAVCAVNTYDAVAANEELVENEEVVATDAETENEDVIDLDAVTVIVFVSALYVKLLELINCG